jgi:hypothetical protein
VVSDPVVAPVSAGTSLSGEASVAVVYVSLPPGTIPDGEQATIRNPHTGASLTVPMVDGGFDPVPLEAAAGDTVELDVRVPATDAPLLFAMVVPERRPPIVVRTDPPPRKRDVPLNAAIMVVFSEPMDSRTITPGNLQLLRAGAAVAGRVGLAADGLRANFVPDSLLAPATEYVLSVARAADRSGDTLEAPLAAAFVTGNTTGSIRIWLPDTVRAAVADSGGVGTIGEIYAIVTDANGTELLNVPASWSIQDPSDAIGRFFSVGLGLNGRNTAYLDGRGVPGVVRLTVSTGTASATTVLILDSLTLSAVSAGLNGEFSCYLGDDGRAYCFGYEGAAGTPGVRSLGNLIAVAGDVRYTAISAGVWHACGLATGGAVYCWGDNYWGQTGVPASARVETPTQVAGGLAFRQVSVSDVRSCALTTSGLAYCWGWPLGATGPHQPGPSDHVPTPVPGGLVFSEVSNGVWHTCALTPAGAAYCWGGNARGQLGDGSGLDRTTPVAVAGGLSFAHISAGPWHTCGVTTQGELWCWGEEGWGAGYTPTLPPSTVPVQVPLPTGVSLRSVEVGDGPTCGVASDGSAYCWGFAWDPDRSDTGLGPTALPGGLRFESVSSGLNHSCGVAQDRAVYCWYAVVGQPYRVPGQR